MANTKRKNLEVARIAHHEAGHAVAAIELRIPFKYVTIDPNLRALGHCALSKATDFHPDYSMTLATRDRVERYIMTCYAGLTAEAKFTGKLDFKGAEHDLMLAARLAISFAGGDEEADAYSRWLLVRTRQLWTWPGEPSENLDTDLWTKVKSVAQHLTTCSTLSNRRVREIAASAGE